MTQQEYEQKRRECWEEFMARPHENPQSLRRCFDYAFDRAYALGKQEKDVKKKPALTDKEEMKARRKSDGEIIEVREWRGASDVVYTSPDMNQFYQASELDFNVNTEDTMISGWVARDKGGFISLFSYCPDRVIHDDLGFWGHNDCSDEIDLPKSSFPDLTWDDEPQEVEIIIKKRRNDSKLRKEAK